MDAYVKVYYHKYQENVSAGSSEVKRQHRIGQELLKQGLKKEFNMDYSEGMLVKGQYGKPLLKQQEGFFNISHCKGMVVCAISNVPIGADLECDRIVSENILKKACCEKELDYILKQDSTNRFLQIWTLKESYIKMTGEGLRVPLKEVSFAVTPRQEAVYPDWKDSEDISCRKSGWFYQTRLEEKFILSLCTKERSGLPLCVSVL